LSDEKWQIIEASNGETSKSFEQLSKCKVKETQPISYLNLKVLVALYFWYSRT